MNTTRSCRSLSGTHAVVTLAATMLGWNLSRPTRQDANNNAAKDVDVVSTPLQSLSPTSPIYIFHPNPNLEIAFDTRTRNPLYVLEHITPSKNNHHQQNSTAVAKLKRPNFYEEKSLPEEFRSRVSHYRNSGFDRGHLAAAANYMHTTQQEVNDTFNLINISPQDHAMNCSIWAQLERWVQKVAQENEANQHDTFVVSGPLWMPALQTGERLFEYRYSALGIPPSLVSVPTHFYKIVIALERKTNQICKFACFVIPNQDLSQGKTQQQRRVLADFVVPWSALEAVTGLHFFPKLVNSSVEWKETANRLTLDIAKKSGKSPTLLLTDGSDSSNNKSNNKWRFGQKRKVSDLSHFCANGSCS